MPTEADDTMSDDKRGGWLLTVTCACGATDTFDGVVPALADDKARKADWDVSGGPLRLPQESREGMCPLCRTTLPERRAVA